MSDRPMNARGRREVRLSLIEAAEREGRHMTSTRTKAAGASALARAGLTPRLLDRTLAAAYVGVSPVAFDALVEAGRMPPPKALHQRRAWCRHALDDAIDRLPDVGGGARVTEAEWEARA